MARHNRDGQGWDQRGFEYIISYQPDWLKQVKVTRLLPTGRQSTKVLFAPSEPPEREPGRQVRTQIRSEAQGLAFEVALTDPERVVKRIIVETGPGSGPGVHAPDDVQFTIEHRG
ncbi:MAG: hypothetical protein ACLFRX_00740 [Gemmatimonadota bacterium]